MSINTSGKNNPNYGKKASPEKLKKMSDGIKKAYEDNPEIRTKMSISLKETHKNNPEIRKRLSEARKGRTPMNDMINLYGKEEAEKRMKIIIEERSEKNKKPILQYSIEGIFLKEWDSIKSVADFYDCSEGGLSSCVSEKNLTYKGYIWRPKKDENFEKIIIPKKKKETIVPVLQYNLNGDFVKKWNSMIEIYETKKYLQGAICSACKGNLKRVYGFMWRYYTDDNFQIKIEPFKLKEVHNSTPVLQFTLNMEFVKQYKSISEAEKINEFGNSAIAMVCKGERKTACGFIWKYANVA
jgi:hypothetical protein